MKILVIGEINPDLILQGYQSFPELGKEVLVDDTHLTLGSSSLICAVGLARLGNEVSFLGMVGRDSWGEFCVRAMTEENIDVSRVIRRTDVKTGLTVSVTGPSDRALVTYLGAMSVLTAGDVPGDAFAGFDHLHMACYFMQEGLRPGFAPLFRRASEAGLTVSFDTGFDPSEEWGKDVLEPLREADVFLPNEVEIRGISGREEIVDGLRALAGERTLVVAKLGGQGSMTLVDGAPLAVPALPVEPVDTTGAGDSFNAGFLHRWLRNKEDIKGAMRFGSACGALSTLALGGTTTQPTEQRAEEFLREHSARGDARQQ